MTPTQKSKLLAAATASQLHTQNMIADIRNASTRQEDMRLRRLAIEAENLTNTLLDLLEDEE